MRENVKYIASIIQNPSNSIAKFISTNRYHAMNKNIKFHFAKLV